MEAGTPAKAGSRPQSQPTRLLDEGPPEPELAAPESGELPAGTRVDRYCVLSPLGEGGMGVVYEAWDPRLDRRVALKMLRHGRPRRRGLSRDADLLTEAQALARIEHPNIVTVYDVGVTTQGMYIAMELCRGQSLRRWLTQGERSVREILDVFIEAGRGLAAAHQAGIVHRDFKPANVLIGEDGSVRVADFGLARPFDLTEDGISASLTDSDRETSTIAGTPAYMAPEQLFGRAGDHRMDQFSFCVCLYHALLGHPPFPDRTFDGRRRVAHAGLGALERERLERARHIPGRVRRAVLRGLEVEPDARFGSMNALLEKLVERKRWPWAMTSLALVLGSGLGAIGMSEARPGPCDRADEVLDDTWGRERQRALVEAIERTGHPDATVRAERVVEQLDEHAQAWLEGYSDACRATYVARVQSEPVFDLRMRCLERHRARLDIAVEMMTDVSDPAMLDARMPVPFRLFGVDECSDVDSLEREAPLPEGPLRTRAEELERRIAWANALREGGALQDGLEVARATVAEARLLEHPAVLARALESLGRLQADGDSPRTAEATLREAIEVGARGQDDRLVARAWASLLFTLVLQRELDAGETLGYAAEVAVVRAGDEEARGWLQNNLGILHGEKGDHERAREHLERALEVKRRLLGAGHLDVGITWINLGSALGNSGRWAEAADAYGRAREIFAATVGVRHPLHDIASTGLCRVAVNSGQHDVALDLCTRALGRLEATATSPALESRVRVYKAKALVGLGRVDEALRVAEEARAQVEGDDPAKAGEIGEWMEEVRGEVAERERAG